MTLLPLACLPATNIYDNFSFGYGGYTGNSTDVDIQLPLYYALRMNFSVSSLDSKQTFGYSLGLAKDLTQDFSFDITYGGNSSNSYISDSIEALFSYRPFMMISTFLEFQVKGGYAFILHSNEYRTKNIPCHAIKIGMGGGFMQTTSLAIMYTFYQYAPSVPDNDDLDHLNGFYNLQLAGYIGVISDYAGSTLDFSISHYLADNLNIYFSYSYIRYAPDNNVNHSYLMGVDYYLLPNWSTGLAYNLLNHSDVLLSPYYSVNTRINF